MANLNDASSEESSHSERAEVDDILFSDVTHLFRSIRYLHMMKKRGRSRRRQLGVERRALLEKFWIATAEKTSTGRELLAKRKSDEEFIPARIFAAEDAFKLICFLVPALDTEHSIYGMKQKTLAEEFIKALDLPKYGEDATWLRNYHDKSFRPESFKLAEDVQDGSFPSVLKAVVQYRCEETSQLTIGAVWEALSILSEVGKSAQHGRYQRPNYGGRKQSVNFMKLPESESEKRSYALKRIISAGTPNDVAEFSRIILKETDLNISQEWFLSWFHRDAKQHYNQTHDLRKLISDFLNPSFEIGEFQVQFGRYASVMLTQRPSRKNLKTICKSLLGEGDRKGLKVDRAFPRDEKIENYFLVEPKLDGERMQLHMSRSSDGDSQNSLQVRTFSRRGNKSDLNADVMKNVIGECINAQAVILDGEFMIFDVNRETWLPFENISLVMKQVASDEVPNDASYIVKFMVFDVLFVNQGKTESPSKIVRMPLHRRREVLEKIVKPKKMPYIRGVEVAVEIVKAERSNNEDKLLTTLWDFVRVGYEGAIAKNPDQPYLFGERQPHIAIKLKPDYFDGGLQDLDVLILGARFSTSTSRVGRMGDLSTFLIGVKDDSKYEANDGKWLPVGAVGTGYSDSDLKWIRDELDGHWRDFDPHNLPAHFSEREDQDNMYADVSKWIPPNKSLVLTVLAYELSMKNKALRFPRVVRINKEKDYFQATTINDVIERNEERTIPCVRADRDDEDDDYDVFDDGLDSRKKRKTAAEEREKERMEAMKAEGTRITGASASRAVLGTAKGADVSDVKIVANCFTGKVFLVVGDIAETKSRAEIKIHELGGRFVQSFSPSVDFVIGMDGMHLDTILKKFKADPSSVETRPILRIGWLLRCRAQERRVEFLWRDIFFAPPGLCEKLLETSDRYGDPWEKDITAENLLQCIHNVLEVSRNDKGVTLSREDEARLPSLDEAVKQGGSLFSGRSFFAPRDLDVIPRGASLLVKALGGTLVSSLGPDVSVLVHISCEKEARKGAYSGCDIVTDRWVREQYESAFESSQET